ncbi:MAG: substrate-binding domain-containing protein [Syntrophomonas sp.]
MRKYKSMLVILAICMMAVSILPFNVSAAAAVEDTLTLATTTSTQDSGLLDILVPAFEQEYKTKVKVIAVGSGQAMEMGKKGDADVLLVHSRKAEDEFVDSGYGINRKDVMYNQFLVVGPATDPAKIKGMTNAAEAFKKIADSKSKFISRADKSGTHTKELNVWKAAKITPELPWYIEAGKGMGDTLLMANEMNAYTLADEATWLTWQRKTTLTEVVKGDKILFNPYGVIQVNPAKFPTIHKNAAQAFSDFITGSKGQAIIASFGKEKYGKGLFVPDAKAAAPAAPAAVAPAANQAPAASATSSASTITGKNLVIKVYAANIRSGAGTNYRILGSAKKGAQLEVVGASGKWYQVKFGNRTGYIAGWLVTLK